ncbi:Tpr-related protein family member, putative [Theileria annulata]|uniref:Tpr-related protein family member, putative n=1 Tax=Theileria annulata TaxID=5874 RepID=Q4UEW5_THEAN|nr:Tpr-related protein family member, putative [Theileria annulata]CAI74374.1 Tpr-related protein family member, putative [Theileria annulata]|eukprot:XP_952106.1 Tpr-related protein family member, putative [Theileria annulata]
MISKALMFHLSSNGVNTVETVAGDLAGKAQELYNQADGIVQAAQVSGSPLSTLSTPATALASAAKGTDGQDKSSLHHQANELSSATPTDPDKAIAVITAFATVKDAYENLAAQTLYQENKRKPGISPLADTPAGKVKAVETAWKGVESDFQKLCMALIKHFANQVENNATSLASANGNQTHADKVITSFNVVEKAYDSLNRILNLTKLAKKATKLKEAASPPLQSPAGGLASAARKLNNTDVVNAQAFKDTVKSTIRITGNTGNKNITVTNLPHINDTFKPRQIKFWAIIIPSIISQCYRTDEELKAATSTGENLGLRALALALHTQANELNRAVDNPGSNDNAANVLKHKAGTDDQTDGKLRKLAETLYTAASQLASAVQAGPDTGKTEAEQLANEVGENEEGDKLRAKLKDLGNYTQDTELTTKAGEVKTKYDAVSRAFTQVQLKEDKYTEAGHQDKYQAVEKAWDAFNDVYKPEELLVTAVGEEITLGDNLASALKELGTASILDIKGLNTKANAVKEKFAGWGPSVKQKFELVQAQESAYTSGGIKSTKYDPLEQAFNNFNTAYRKAICGPKFYSIIVPSIISMLSECPPKTEFVGSLGGFGGWKQYNDGGNTVYGQIWHFFDILIVIKFTVAIIFIYSLNYRELHSY